MNNQKIFTLEEEKENNERKTELIELVKSREAVLMVGAGSSVRVGHPDWSCLLIELEDFAVEYNKKSCESSQKKVQEDLKKPSFWQKLSFFVRFLYMRKSFKPNCEKRERDPLTYAEDIKSFIYKQKDGQTKYYALLEQLFESKDPPCTDFHRKLIAMPFRGILTTNYDRVLEAALGEIERLPGDDNSLVISEDSAGQVNKFLMGMTDTSLPRRVAHLHGRYDYPKNIILSGKEYQKAYGLKLTANQVQKNSRSTLHQKLLWSILASRRVVFVGFSMNDPYFKRLLETVSNDLWRRNKSTHYAILGILPDRAEYSKAKELKRNYNIDTVFYNVFDDSHQGLEDIVDEIAKKCGVEIRSPMDDLDWLEQTNRRMEQFMGRRIDNEINRERLLTDLQDFALRGNGVIIGSPGVGKTYLLKELRQNLKSDGIPHLLLPIDQLGEGTDDDLQRELSLKGDLIEKLKSIPVPDQKAILLFDAFDASRDKQTRERFLRLIRRAIQELNGLWNVAVTIRTYDAEKSHKLLALFGNLDNADLTQYRSQRILYRHFTIPSLNKDEIQQAFGQISDLESIYNNGSEEFKKLLANPFNLWLLEEILKTSQDVHTFSQICSEVQLLDWFWEQRTKDEDDKLHRQFLLEQIVCWMIKERSLTVRQNDVYKDLGLDNPARQRVWNDLLSDEILAKISPIGQRIAFSHDILFDYAISVLLIDDEPRQLERFVSDDPSRPIFLRPSFTYFFTRLWYDNDVPEKFWNAFWCVFRSNQSAHLRIARLIPTSVIANETRGIDQLKPLLEKLQNGEEIANGAITCLLQLLRALQIKHDPLWIDFFDQVSAHLHRDFAWDLATLTSEILEQATKKEDTAVIEACGRIGRRLLGWIWQERETGEDDWYDQLGDYSAVSLVAKTYSTDVEESRTLLEKVLALKQGDYFPTDSLTRLAEHVDKIWDHNPEFTGLIYRAGITSTRGHNEIACHTRLVEHFPDFLRATPLIAAQAVIEGLNSYTHTFRDPHLGMTVNEMFNFRGKHACFVEDNGHAWNELRIFLAEPTKMAKALFEFITELAMSQDLRLDSLLDVFCDYVEVAPFWKHLLKTAAQFPEVFAPRLYELCMARPIQMSEEVFYELCTFLEIAAPEFTPEQRLQIEKSILDLPSEDGENHEFLEQRRNQLLAQIPPDLLWTDDARKIREEMEHKKTVPVNQSSVNVSSGAEAYTNEKWLQKQGLDTTKPENQELQHFFEPLDKFNSNWRNDMPTEELTESILPTLEEGYASIKKNTGADKAIVDSLWYKLTACTAILAQVEGNPESRLFVLCREVLLHGATHELPQSNPELDAQSDSLPYYSPLPRHEAACGLLRLTAYQSDAEMLDAIEKLASDPVPSVRMVTAAELFMIGSTSPERFWYIMDNRATYETNRVVQEYLYATLTQVVAESEEKTTCVMDKLLKPTLLSTETLEPADSCVNLLMYLAIDRENSWALETIEDTFFKDPIRFANFLSCAVYWVMKDYVVTKNLKTPNELAAMQRAIAWLSKVITVVSDGIVELCAIFKAHRSEEAEQQLHDIYIAINEITACLHSEVVRENGQSEEPIEKISDEMRCCFYNEIKPLMEGIVAIGINAESGAMFAPIAYHLLQLLTSFLSCNPKEVLHLAEGVARSSKQSGYDFNSLVVEEVVKFVEIVLADHRNEVRDGQGLKDLQNLLDIFVEAGWSEAIELVLCLDEIYR